MATLFSLLIILSVCLVNADNSGAGVYGIAGPNYKDGASSLIKIDINTGTVTTIVGQKNIADPKLTGQNLGCFDAANDIYYFLSQVTNTSSPTGQTTVLFGYDLSDPSNKIDEIKFYDIKAAGIVGLGDACIGDPNTGDLYVFGHDANNATNQLLYKMSSNGKLEVIGNYYKINDSPLIAGDPTILDTKRDMLWVAGSQSGQELYFYIDLKTGQLVKNINFRSYPLIQGSIYNEKYDSIIGVGFADLKNGLYEFDLVYANSVNLNITKKCDADMIGYCGQLKTVTQDNDNEILYGLMLNSSDCNNNYTNDVYLVGTDIQSGEQLTSVLIGEIDGVLNTAPQDIQYWNGNDI